MSKFTAGSRLLLTTLLTFCSIAAITNGADLFPYQAAKQILIGQNFSEHAVDLSYPIVVSGKGRWQVSIITNGLIAFSVNTFPLNTNTAFPSSIGEPLIAALQGLVLGIHNTKIFQQEQLDPRMNQQFTNVVNRVDIQFQADWSLTVTWEDVTNDERGMNAHGTFQENSFQVVLAVDHTRRKTYAIFNYNKIEWIEDIAEAGFNVGDKKTTTFLPGVDYAGALYSQLLSMTNVGTPGRFAIRIDRCNTYSSTPNDCLAPCESGWFLNTDDNVCVKAFRGYRRRFKGARIFCRKRQGGELIYKVNTYRQRWYATHKRLKLKRHFWIGVSDLGNTGTLKYEDGTTVDTASAPFKEGKSYDVAHGDHCLALKGQWWYPAKCDQRRPVICQKPPAIGGR